MNKLPAKSDTLAACLLMANCLLICPHPSFSNRDAKAWACSAPKLLKKKSWAPSKAPREAALASPISSCSSASHCLMPTQPGMSPLAAHISALLKASARFETVWP